MNSGNLGLRAGPARQLGLPSLRSAAVPRINAGRAASKAIGRKFDGLTPAAGGGSTGGGSNKGYGGGGGGNGDSGSGKGDDNNQPKKSGLLTGWEQRVAYDPEFPIKVMLEQIIGVGASVVGDMSSRPNWGLNELDFVFSTLVVGSIMNFSIMYLLAPTAGGAAAGAAGGSFIARALSDQTLKSWGAPGGNMFEPGAYSAGKRLLNFGYKGAVFSCIGFIAGIAGTSVSNGLLLLRKQLDPNFKLVNEQPNVVFNAATWALHMGLSSNARYQTLGALDTAIVKVMPIPAFRVYQALIRAGNNVVGGISFVTLARIMGVQKAAAPAPAPAPAAPAAAPAKGDKKKDK
uniref:Uncharacterized protein n=1 Tax=Chlamydomonas leiostraca TaxID=1034604 RepID=A0A7S0S1J2_9CHLO|mmetsp:Transcript_38158/g.96557  ORF Transcript_38158/g.96557 Transcript_38158/m.96557 type:complete len:346 (+) Transcript_38158:3-1040(+)